MELFLSYIDNYFDSCLFNAVSNIFIRKINVLKIPSIYIIFYKYKKNIFFKSSHDIIFMFLYSGSKISLK